MYHLLTPQYGRGLSFSRPVQMAIPAEAARLYLKMQQLVDRVGEYANKTPTEARALSAQIYQAIAENVGLANMSNDEYWSGPSPTKLREKLGIVEPAEEELPTPRTLQFISEGIQSPPAGPGMSKGSGRMKKHTKQNKRQHRRSYETELLRTYNETTTMLRRSYQIRLVKGDK